MMAPATATGRPRRIKKLDLHAPKQPVDFLAIVRACGHKPKRRGAEEWKINCPFHDDAKESLVVTPSKSLWQCSICGKGGSAIDFVSLHDHLSAGRTIMKLSDESNVPVESSAEIGSPPGTKPRTPQQQAILNKTAEFYHKTFQQCAEGKAYLKSRGISDPALLETFRIGYANDTIKNALPPDGELIADLKAIGILNMDGKEHFRDCVVFPIYDPAGTGNVLGMHGRKTHPAAKPCNLCLPGPYAGVWNHWAFKRLSAVASREGAGACSSKIILVTEEIMDACTLWQAGYKNAIALYGTDGFTEAHMKMFAANRIETAFLVMSGDHARKGAAVKLSERLRGEGLDVFIVNMPDGERPNKYFQKHTAEDFEKLLQEAGGNANGAFINSDLEPAVIAPRPGGFSMTLNRRRYAVQLAETNPARIRATIKALTADRNRFHIDTVELFSARSRKTFIADVAALYREEEAIIAGDMNRIVAESEKIAAIASQPCEIKAAQLTEEDRKEGEKYGKRKDLLDAIFQDVEKCGYIGERANSLAAYLCMTSRKMDDPLALLIVSGSGAGKSALQETVLALCPEEDLVKVTSLTERALFYKDELSLKHKVLALEESAGAENAAYAIRNLISQKTLIIESTIKDPLTGRLTTMENRVYGPTSVFQTTIRPDVDPETLSRFLVTTIDESREQTKRILEAQRKARTLEGFKLKIHRKDILKKHHAFQRLLKPLPVFNPFSELLTFTDERLLTRRDQPKYLQLIETIAFLRQMQKPVKQAAEDGNACDYIEVSLPDIALANELAIEILGRSLDDLSGPSRRLLLLIEELVCGLTKERKLDPAEALFTRRELREFTRWSDYQIHHYLNQLVALEYLVPVCGRNGSQYQYRLVWDGQGKTGERFVLGLKTVEQLRKDANLLGFSGHLLE